MGSQVKVCVIGAGAAGLSAARHLNRLPQLFTVNVFEQTESVGGTWVYTPRTGVDINGQPIHQSMYKNLRTNLPKEIMRFPDFHFDPHLPSFIHHTEMANYLQQYAEHFNLIPYIQFNTVVCSIESAGTIHEPLPIGDDFYGSCELPRRGFSFTQWKVTTQNLISKAVSTNTYDAVVVCNGHYSTPFAMDIPGIENFPSDKFIHSHSYRDPKFYQDQVVLVIGAGSSGKDICMDVATEATRVILSSRKSPIACPLPTNVEQFVEVEQILASGVVVFKDGKELSPDGIIMCNGYDFNFPFLDNGCGVSVSNRTIYPLYKHVFNAINPSMAFIGVNITVLPFPYFDLQSHWVFSVWAGFTKLPSAEEMVAHCDQDWAKQETAGIPRRYMHRLANIQWDYYREVALMGANQPLDHVIQKLYTTIYQYRASDLISYKDYQFVVTGHSSFLLLSDSTGPVDIKEKRRVAVIGAGASGLCAVRHCSKFTDCISVTLFEQGTEIVGRKWPPTATHHGLLPNKIQTEFRTNLPRDITGFLDFAYLPNADSFPTCSQAFDYLKYYCKQYGLLQHMKFGHQVNRVSLQESSVGGAGDKWLVEVTDLTNQTVSYEEFDNIFISTECFYKPFSSIEGLDLFPSGCLIHSRQYQVPHSYRDKVVAVVIDSDPQGIEIVREVVPFAKEVIVISAETFSEDNDLPSSVQHVSYITKIVDNQVVQFSDGTSKRVDNIVLCTNYKYTFPYLSDSYGFNTVDKRGMHQLYKATFSPHYPSMAFLGTPMDTTFAYCDMQVMWALRVWLGLQPLPHTGEMLSDCKNERDISNEDLAVLYKELATCSETVSPSPAFLGICKEIGSQMKEKSKSYTVLSSEHWIVTNN